MNTGTVPADGGLFAAQAVQRTAHNNAAITRRRICLGNVAEAGQVLLTAQQCPLERTGDTGNAICLRTHEHLAVTRSAQAVVVPVDRCAEGRGEDINAIGSGVGGRGAQAQPDGGDQQGEAWVEAIILVVHGAIRPGFKVVFR